MARFQFFPPDRRLTDDWLTDKTDCLTPLRACARGVITRARMREAGLSNRFCLSVSQSSVRWKKLKSRHIDPQKTSKWSQTIANSKKNCSMCTWLKSRRSVSLYFGYFLLFITIHNIGSTSSWLQEQDTQCIWKLHASRWPLGNSAFSRSMYFTDIMAIVSAVFSSYFLLFVTFGPTSPASQYSIYGKRSLPHLGYGHTRTQYTR